MFGRDGKKTRTEEIECSSPADVPTGIAPAPAEEEGYKKVSAERVAKNGMPGPGVSTLIYRVGRANFDLAVIAFLCGLIIHIGFSLARFFAVAICISDIIWLCIEIGLAGLALIFYVHTRPGKIVEAFAYWAKNGYGRVSASGVVQSIRKNLDFLILGLVLLAFLSLGFSLYGLVETLTAPEMAATAAPLPAEPTQPRSTPTLETPSGQAAKEIAEVILHFLAALLAVCWNFYLQVRTKNPVKENLVKRGNKPIEETDCYGRSVVQ